ncbi:MAG: hypothetical protein ACAI34_17800, partial [Verrucomicrobium sp.]
MKTPSLPKILERRLEPLAEADRTIRAFKFVVSMLVIGVLLNVGMTVFDPLAGLPKAQKLGYTVGAYALFAAVLVAGWYWITTRPANYRKMARQIEEKHPELQAMLLTALDKPDEDSGLSRYLHDRVVNDAVRHGISNDWMGNGRRWQLRLWKTLGIITVLALLAVHVLSLIPTGQAK